MEKIISKGTAKVMYRIGIYQIAGGALGILFLLWNISVLFQPSLLSLLLYAFIIALFSFSILCGILCVKKHDKALSFSFANQLLQSIGFAIGGYAFSFMAGVYFTIDLGFMNAPGLSFSAGIPKCLININTDDEQSVISFNLIAIWIFYEVVVLRNQIKEDSRDHQINSLGQN